MAELIDDVLELLAPWPTANSLASVLSFESANEASTSAQLAVPLLVSGMVERLKDPDAASGLVDLLPAIDVGGLQDLEGTFTERRFEPIGSDAIGQALAGRHQRAADAVAEEVGCSPAGAFGVFPPMAWLVLGVIVERHGAAHNRHTMLNIVQTEEAALLKAGWGEWMSVVSTGTESEAPSSTPSSVLQPGSAEQAEAPVVASYPPPVSRASRTPKSEAAPAVSGAGRVVSEPSPDEPSSAEPPARPSAAVRTRYADGEIEKVQTLSRPEDSGRGLMLLGIMMVVGLSGALIWYLSNRGDETVTGAPEPSAETDGVSAGGEDGSTTSTNGAEEVLPIAVVLSDKTGASPDLSAVASLRLDVDGGQVCYEIDTEGFDDGAAGQISQGEEGVQGRMIVDLGPLAESSSGCAIADPLRVKAALDDPVGHYLLLTSPDRTVSISGRLAGSELATDSPTALIYDPDGGGAFVIVDNGRFILDGEVPDSDTADRLIAEFEEAEIDPDGIENSLEVVSGAANPSGRIVLQDDLLFAIGSAELAAQESASLAQLAKLFVARPDWQISVLGHTDNTGNPVANLALSQERAEAVRAELVSLGVSDFAIEATGVGDTDPVGDNDTDEGREQNRRIEFQVRSRSG